jgi:EAL domain-containing protein (putative c-di-GMP-specific phosphodiesterase class I)
LIGSLATVLARSNPLSFLRKALAEDRFAIYCQPMLGLKTDQKHPLAEVLVRMADEENAMLPPGEFLPVFEELKIMPELDRWVLHQTLIHAGAGSAIDAFCVNLSPQTIDDPDFSDFVMRELTFSGVPPARLFFEVTEADAAAKPGVLHLAGLLRELGAGLVIEDFLCRPESFRLMQALRAHAIKVDGAIMNRRASEETRAALETAVSTARPTGTRVIATGIEDLQTLVAVIRLGADYAQGFGVYGTAPIRSWLKR